MLIGLDTVEEFWTWEQVEQAGALARDSSREAFEKDLSRFIGVDADRVHLMPSGHQGLEWLLRSRLDSRRCVNARFPKHPDVKDELDGADVGVNAKIGANTTVLPGLVLGANALVGAGSVVTKDVDEDTIVAGSPASIKRKIHY